MPAEVTPTDKGGTIESKENEVEKNVDKNGEDAAAPSSSSKSAADTVTTDTQRERDQEKEKSPEATEGATDWNPTVKAEELIELLKTTLGDVAQNENQMKALIEAVNASEQL
tara:strand:+ start:978 stop:1313 length:336 start_codon:yes stop_codon:yes gene_type:complete